MITQSRKSSIAIRREDVSLSDRDIISRYIGIHEFPCKISSPLREDDDRPSFVMRERDGKVFWKDFGTGCGGDAVGLMSKLWSSSYNEALLKIKLDTEHRIPRATLIRRYNGKIHLTKGSTIKVKTREWKPWDIEYWNSYGISEKFAHWCNVYPISHAIFTKLDENDRPQTVTIPMDKYAYAFFEWKDGVESIKLYQPYSQTMKWLSKHDASVWDLWKHAFRWADEKSDASVIITSSRKDAMCLWENLNVPAMSLQGEGYLPKPQVIQQVLDRFKTVYLWYDNDFSHTNDNPGQDNARKLIELYPTLQNVYIPSELQVKDPSDLVKTYGRQKLKDFWDAYRRTSNQTL
ncbi:MAG: hypothetical protein II661_10440 [Bacteroidales bacterium]|nr:hypothetical protein [Bacteroidales bacterium]